MQRPTSKNICKRIEETLGITLKSYDTPMATNDHPETDDSGFLNAEDHSKYRMLVGSGQWAIILGRLDIMQAVQTMSRFSSAPKQGHLDRMLRIFGYLKNYPKYGIVFDNQKHETPPVKHIEVNWDEQYPGAREELPDNMPVPKGNEAHITCYVDADHAGDSITHRSRTGFLIYANSAPVYWMSKNQNSAETSLFVSEFIAMKQCCEYLHGLCYKLRMMGIPFWLSAYVYEDN